MVDSLNEGNCKKVSKNMKDDDVKNKNTINLEDKKIKISPSVLSLSMEDIPLKLKLVENNIDYIHIDVMDGIFVTNKTNGVEMFNVAKQTSKKTLDVHLMVEKPAEEIQKYEGAEIITFHIESILEKECYKKSDLDNANNNFEIKSKEEINSEIEELINKITLLGAKVGISIKPNTPVSILAEYLDKVDLILIMTVEPGYGGQNLIPEMLSKIDELRKMGYKKLIEIDGGVTIENAAMIKKHDVDIIVAGTAIFSADNENEAIKIIKK